MPYKILEKKQLAEKTILMKIHSPRVAKRALPGQFVILRIDEAGERIPLTIAEHDDMSVTIVFLVVGKTTMKLEALNKGDSILDFVGPLGMPSHIEKVGTVVLIGGGLGIAPLYPQAKAFKEKGNKVITILGARSKTLLFWQDRLAQYSDEVLISTDDGSAGAKGVVTEVLKQVMAREKVDLAVAVGPPIMMKFVALATKEKNVRTVVSLNPIMVDGTGMCGGCRVLVDNKTKFACVDGPEFDGHQVDWDDFLNRLTIYKEEEHKCMMQND